MENSLRKPIGTTQPGSGDAIEYVIDASKYELTSWRELWRFRELFFFFTWRDVKIKYKQTTLGLAWAVLQPLLLMIVFTLFFGRVLHVPSQSLPYPVFVFSGLLLWTIFSNGLTNAANSMVTNAHIIKKIYFPRLVIPASAVLVSLFDFLMSLVVFLPLLIVYDQSVSWNALVYWPVAILIVIIATLGPGCLLAALNVKYRDFRYIIPFIVQVLFFISPVLYPVSMLQHPVLQYVLALSPVYAAIELFRHPMTGGELNTVLIGISLFSGVALLLGGILYFKLTEDFFADFA